MGRKIPGRKHRGIRDPEKQAAVRFDSIKDKINAPPSKPEEQQISKSLQRVIDLKNKVKSGAFNTKCLKNSKTKSEQIPKERKSKAKAPNFYREKPIPTFKQSVGESDRDFVKRMNRICMDVTREAEFEEKYGVEVQRNEDGEVEGVVKRPKDELELYVKKLKKDKQNSKKKKKKKEMDHPRLTKWQKRVQKLKEKKMNKDLHNVDEFKQFKDDIKFGEIVHAPPTLVTPRKIGKQQNTPRPGNKNLLLKSIITPEAKVTDSSASVPTYKENLRKVANKVINRKGKRKDLPNALRRQLDKQQTEIIGAYKQLKAKKYAS